MKEGMKFCFKCGKAVDESPAANNENPNADANAGNKTETIKKTEKKWNGRKINPKIIGAAAAGILLIGGGIYFANHRYTTFDLQDYLEVTIAGYNKVGIAKAYVDNEKLFDDIYRAASKKSNMSFSGENQLYELADVDVELSKSENLSNGDEITVSFANINEKALKDYKIKYKSTPKKVKVKGLEDVDIVDVFKDLEIPFEGIAPKLSIPSEFTKTVDGREYRFSATPCDELAVGDTVTITCLNSEAVDGAIPEKSEVTVTVPDTVDQYITDPKLLTKDMYNLIIDSANKKFESQEWFKGVSAKYIYLKPVKELTDLDAISTKDCIVSNFKIDNEALFFNTSIVHSIYLRFEVDVTNDGQTYHAYGYTYATNLIKYADGTFDFTPVEYASDILYVDEADRENDLEFLYTSASTLYRITLDGSEAPEVLNGAEE